MIKLPIKYKVDFAILNDRKEIISWAEVKRREHKIGTYSTYMISLDKYLSGMHLHKLTGLPFNLVVKFTDNLYHCEIHLLSYAQITISMGGRTDRSDEQDIEPCVFFDIDLFKCVYCGFCEEACPVDAIVETKIFEFHFENRNEKIISKDKLLEIGDLYEIEEIKDRENIN